MKIRIYGAFQDGTRASAASTDVCFGDRLIFETLRENLAGVSEDIDFVLPDEKEKVGSLGSGDVLIIGGGGLIHPNLLSAPVIKSCRARKAVFGVGINWGVACPLWTIYQLSEIAESCFKDIPFVCVRDFQTKAFLRMERARVCPDVIFLNWKEGQKTGNEKAVIEDGELKVEQGEAILSFHKQYSTNTSLAVTSLDQLKRFGSIRTISYHGMLAPLVLGSIADVTMINVKQAAFFMSYKDKLQILKHDNNRFILRCTKPEDLFRSVKAEFQELVSYIRTK